MNKKLQVFISSTYTDLIEERQVAIQAILDAGHTPAGMEFFNVDNESQFKTICRRIDESDVYMLILGGHYGSINKASGLSYTELEYRYALSKNMPVFAIVLDENFLFTKASSYDKHFVLNSDTHQYNRFKSFLLSRIVKTVKNITELKISIISILNNINTLYSYTEWSKTFPKIPNHLNDILLFNATNFNSKIEYYYNIVENFEIKSISNITANKCILDPLGDPISDITNIRIDVAEVNDWMLSELNKNPTDLYKLSSRRFEELVAEILIRKGYNVELTPATRDGGKDIYAARKDDLGSFLYVVECKKYKPTCKVGVNVLRDLYGILSKERATYGVAVTTSYFSKPAQDFHQELKFQMSLHDFDSIKQWLYDVTHNNSTT